MQIIQSIRDKGAAITITVIALALIAFILMDAKSGSNNMNSGSSSSSMGKVNGRSIDKDDFNKRVNVTTAQQEQQNQRKLNNAEIDQVRTQVWNQMVDEKVIYNEADKLGIKFTEKEFSALITSNDPSNPVLNEVLDPNTKQIDQAKVREVINAIKKPKPEVKDMIDVQILDAQRSYNTSIKYYGMISASSYYPTWMEQKDNKESKAFSSISYVAVPYTTISDSTIKVTDEDVQKYIDQHKELFKQDAGRILSYVSFSQLPSVADSIATRNQIMGLKNEFAAETNVKAFISRNSANIPYDSTYKPKAQLKTSFADSIVNTPSNAVYGPFVEGNSYILSRVLGTKMLPDSAGARHILIATVDAQSGQPIMDDSTAKKKADSIYLAIKGGANFALMAAQFSTDQGSKDKGGEYNSIYPGQMVGGFNDYVFNQPVGSMGVIKTEFGYHVIEVTKQKGMSPAYKIAFVAKEIIPSEATISAANMQAIKASAEKEAKQLDAYLQKNGLQKVKVPALVKESDSRVGNLQDARGLVNWAFKADKGDVSEPFSIGNEFVVAVVERIYKKGIADVETARAGGLVENSIREEKKAEQIIKKMGANPTLESVAASMGVQVMTAGADSSLTFNNNIVKEFGSAAEPKLVGASFNKEFQAKVSAPIKGKTGVFIIKVNSIGEKPADAPEAGAAIRLQRIANMRQQEASKWYSELIEKADIKDNRSKFF